MNMLTALTFCLSSSVLAQPWTETFNSSTFGSYTRGTPTQNAAGEWSVEYFITVKHLNVEQVHLQQPFVLTLLVNQANVKFNEVKITPSADLSANNNADNQSALSYCTVVISPEFEAQDNISLFRKGVMITPTTNAAPLVIGFSGVGIGQFGDATTPGEITASGIGTLLIRTQIGTGNAWGTLRANGSGQYGRPASIAAGVANGTTGWRGSVVSDNGEIGTFRAPNGTIIGSSGLPSVISAKKRITWIEARNLNAIVETTATDGTGYIGYLNITNGGTFTGSYTTDFIGGPNIENLPPGLASIVVTGNLDANVFLTDSIRNSSNTTDEINVGGSFVAGRTIRVGQQLQSNGVIRIGNASGLAGQIILNAANINPNTAWSGTLNVNNAALP
jgi:hypothetical protein